MADVDIILIGRNEGERLVRALKALEGQARRLVYVDSGSTDASVENARAHGADVVALDMSVPFTAARARNAGFDALMAQGEPAEFVHFIDGDCAVVAGWIDEAVQTLKSDPSLALVTGWQSEIYPEASIYNQMADVEWHRPAGEITACIGNMLVRTSAFQQVGGFDPTIIAAEDDEFCTRLRKAGWRLLRLPRDMTRHDANITRFSQWWRRAIRSGHGFAQVGALHPEYFVRERARAWIYGAALPLVALIGAAWSLWWPMLVASVYVLNYAKTARGLQHAGLARRDAWRQAILLVISKFPNLIGMIIFYWRRWRNAQMRLIEYK